jgi:hypothetical protein
MLVKEVKMWRQGTPLGLSNEELVYRTVFAIRNVFFPDPILEIVADPSWIRHNAKLVGK